MQRLLPVPLNNLPQEVGGFIILVSLLVLFLWVWSLGDALKRKDFKSNVEKLIWVYVIVSTFFLGTILYYFLSKRK